MRRGMWNRQRKSRQRTLGEYLMTNFNKAEIELSECVRLPFDKSI